MDYFDDDWGNDDFVKVQRQEPVQAEPRAPQQNAIAPTITQQPVGSSQPVQFDSQPATTGSSDVFGMNQFNDGWGDEPRYDQQFNTAAQDPPPAQAFIQEAKVTQEQKDVEEEVPSMPEKEPEPVEDVAPAPPAPAPVKAAPMPAPIAPSRNVITSSTVADWGNNKSFASSAASQTRNNRPNRPRKGPITTQTASVPPKHTIQTEASSVVTQDDTIKQLMEKVRGELEMKVQELETNQRSVSSTVVTLNSTGAVNSNGLMIWDSNHIIKPRKDLKLSNDNTEVIVLVRGLYQITFTTCGPNPTLLVNGDTYAAALSPASAPRSRRTGTTSINIYLFLAEDAKIAGRINKNMLSEGATSIAGPEGDPCEHWLCARLVHGGF